MRTKVLLKATDPRRGEEYSTMMIESPSDYRFRVQNLHNLGYRDVEIYKLIDISSK